MNLPPFETFGKSVTLHCTQGGSDKVYQASIDDKDDGFMVNFAYGRRGSTLKAGSKTKAPVDFDKAKGIYNTLVNGKLAKGYYGGAADILGAQVQAQYQTDFQERDTGIYPQLLNPIEEAEANRLVTSALFWMQEKHDGQRMMVRKLGDKVDGINRKGLTRALPKAVEDHAKSIEGDFLIDGESIGDKLFAFDLLEMGSVGTHGSSYASRLTLLEDLIVKDGPIEVVKTARTAEEKAKMLADLRNANAEGAVFKDKTAYHEAGRPDTGGSQLKFKFYDTASVLVVAGREGKRSVGMEVIDNGLREFVGNVTIPPNKDVPQAGQIIEVRYLYAYRGGSIYQPTYLNVRDDIDENACTLRQLKFKRD